MRKIYTLLFILLASLSTQAQGTYGINCADLYFSQYIEPGVGLGTSKAIEVYNPTTATIYTTGYTITLVNNGNCGGASIFHFPTDSILPGDVYVVSGSAPDPLIAAVADSEWVPLNFNGNDALMLTNPSGDTLDIFGVMCSTPTGNSWQVGFSDSTQDITLIRKSNVYHGEKNWAVAMYEWNAFPVNTFGFIGSHTQLICGTIVPPVITFDSTLISIGEAAGTINIPISISNPNGSSSSVDVMVYTGSTATGGGVDYTNSTQTITFPAGFTGSISLDTMHIVDDLLVEGTETVFLKLTNQINSIATPVLSPDTILQINIIDNDIAPTATFNFANPVLVSVSENVGTYQLPVISPALGTGPFMIDVNVDLVNSTATLGSDFAFTNQTLSYTTNNDTQYITFSIFDDCTCEPIAENCVFKLANPMGGTIGTDSVYTLAINDNDALPTATWSITATSVSPGLSYQVVVNLSSSNCDTVYVPIIINNNNYAAPIYLTNTFGASINPWYVEFLPGITTDTILLTVDDDFIFSGTNDNFDLDIHSPTGCSTGFATGSGTDSISTLHVTVIENMPQPYFQIASAGLAQSVLESIGTISIPVELINPDISIYCGAAAYTVDVTVSGGSATNGTDYTVTTTATLTNFTLLNNFTDTVKINITNDLLVEGNETFNITLSNPIGCGYPSIGLNGTTTDVIIDDDFGSGPAVSFAMPTFVNFSENAGTILIPVTITSLPTTTDSVSIQVISAAATTPSDYLFNIQNLVFSPTSALTQNVSITLVNDCIPEFPEDVFLSVRNLSTGITIGTDSIYFLNIDDDDTIPNVSLSPITQTVLENVGGTFLILTLSHAFCDTVKAQVNLSNGTATSASDYSNFGFPQTVVFLPNTTGPITVPISITNDLISESTESFNVSLTAISNCNLSGSSTGTITINDDDAAGPIIDFVNTTGSNIESAGTINIPVQVSGIGATAVTVVATITSGSATTGVDLTGTTTQTITFPGGSTSFQNVTLTIVDDAIVEGNETYTITLSLPGGGATLGSNTIFTGTILDNDFGTNTPVIQFNVGNQTVNEGAGVINSYVIVSNANSSPITFNYTLSGSCTNGLDYAPITSSPVTIPPLNASIYIQTNIIDDAISEGAENILITITSPTNATLGATTTQTINVVDNDFANGVATTNAVVPISVFPNPVKADGNLVIRGLTTGKMYRFEVYNLLGKRVVSDLVDGGGFFTLAGKSDIVKGVYFYKIFEKDELMKDGRLVIE